MCQAVYCMFLIFRYVYHMGIDSITSVTCALVVDLPENSPANRPFLPVTKYFKTVARAYNCSHSL